MKNYFKFSLYTFLLGAALAVTSCQKEEPLQEDIDKEQTLTASSATVELMKKTVSISVFPTPLKSTDWNLPLIQRRIYRPLKKFWMLSMIMKISWKLSSR